MLFPENQELEIPTTTSSSSSTATQTLEKCDPTTAMNEPMNMLTDYYDIDSTCSTPYVSAPSSPGRGQGAPVTGFYYSAPASPMHFMLSTAMSSCNSNDLGLSSQPEVSPTSSTCSFEFDFAASKVSTNGTSSAGSMSSADELFLNGQIRPMKLSSHLQRPQVLAPLLDLDVADDEVDEIVRGREAKMRDRSLRRRTRSMSPLRTSSSPFGWHDGADFEVDRSGGIFEDKKQLAAAKNGEEEEAVSGETTPCESGASSRSSSVGRSSSRWVFLKEFLYRSKSEGRNNGHKFWGSLSFSPVKDKIKMEKLMPTKFPSLHSSSSSSSSPKDKDKEKAAPTGAATVSPDLLATESADGKRAKHTGGQKDGKKKVAVNGVGKRRVPPSPHELHYTANRAQAEEMRKKTFLPYRQGLLGCLGFSSKSYGAMNGFARALNPVSSR
ncbi:uncharacterized protein LOC113762623 [Coffea eugenioides]|uniref:Uncharacterized protein n=1 Tax=Coffea arabica TaxID=13443 RepID=A0A6P6WHX3_COFAR|nr:uncharacterized protein LOC113732941 [Coffea arabica]XP_027161958.1 uncharacterized protein LOC113762623 [Coffea eugenioides]